MKINEIKRIYEAAPKTFTPTHYGGAFGANPLMLHSDGKLYFRAQGQIQPWQGNPTGTGLLGKFNPATVKGRIVNGQRVPYRPGENFSNDPTARPGGGTQASTWQDPDAQPTQAARPVTGASYDQGLLRRGSRGAGVKELQAKLGMPKSEQDGIFGPKTEAAVKKLQQSQGIKVDGIVGPETRGAIAKLQAPEDPSAPEQTPPTRTEPETKEPETKEPETKEPETTTDTSTDTTTDTSTDTSANDNQSAADDAQNQNDADFSDPEETPTTQRSARDIWNIIKSKRDALPQGPERVRLSNLMNQINVSTTTPEAAEEILAQAEEISPTEPGDETPTEPETQIASGPVSPEGITSRLSPEAKAEFEEAVQEEGSLIAALAYFKKRANNALRYQRETPHELFGVTTKTAGFGLRDVPDKGVIDISSVPGVWPPVIPGWRNAANAAEKQQLKTDFYSELLGRVKYKTIDDIEESRILQLAGVDMKKKLEEASISINGADSAEVAEILRMMQLAGAEGAKVVGPDDINPGPKPCPICGKVHGPMPKPGGCGSKPEPGMGDMIRMISSEEEELDEWENNAPGHEGDEEYMTSTDAGYPAGNDMHKKKKSYPATAGGDNPMNTESLESELKSRLTQALAEKKEKDKGGPEDHGRRPDSPDLDGDGNTDEPIGDAAEDAKKGKKSKGIQAMIDAGNKKADAETKEAHKLGKFRKRHKKIDRFR